MGFELGDRLKTAIDVTHVTVKPFDGFIFLCGGIIRGEDEPLASARHYAVLKFDATQRLANRPVIIAERMTDILNDGEFHNLLEFEEHIAALCSCIIIFLESPGSIAELGSFAVMPHVSPKLLVFCEQRFDTSASPSFIFLGPLASLRKLNVESVQVFPMEAQEGTSFMVKKELLDECWEDIEEAIHGSLKRSVTESSFDPSQISHQMLLVVALTGLCIALTSLELEECLKIFGVTLSIKHLHRMLRMLERFKLVARMPYGSQNFFFSLKDDPLFIFRSSSPDGAIFDHVRFKADAASFYNEKDKRKSKAIKAYRKKVVEE